MNMNSNPYDEFTEQDHNELQEWFDEATPFEEQQEPLEASTLRLLDEVCEGVELPAEEEEWKPSE